MYATVVLVAASVTTASAQADRDAMASQLLDVMIEVNGAYDTDASQDVVFPSPGQLQPEGYSAWGVGSLNYIRRYARAELQAVASSAVRYLPDFQEFHSVMHTGGVSIAASSSKPIRVEGECGARVFPLLPVQPFPDAAFGERCATCPRLLRPIRSRPIFVVLLEQFDRIGASNKSEVKH